MAAGGTSSLGVGRSAGTIVKVGGLQQVPILLLPDHSIDFPIGSRKGEKALEAGVGWSHGGEWKL